MQEYKVVLERFEGPLDLLIHLIDNAKVSIYDIPIKEITDQYIEYLNKIKIFDLEAASEFLIMASTLLEIKSKMLLMIRIKVPRWKWKKLTRGWNLYRNW